MTAQELIKQQITDQEQKIAAQANGLLHLNNELQQKQEAFNLGRGALNQMQADLKELEKKLAELDAKA